MIVNLRLLPRTRAMHCKIAVISRLCTRSLGVYGTVGTYGGQGYVKAVHLNGLKCICPYSFLFLLLVT